MKKNDNILSQASILLFAGLFSRFLGFLYRIPLTEMLGDVGNSYYGAAYYIYTFFLILSSAGLPSAISKLVANRIAKDNYIEAHRIFRISLVFSAVLGFVSMIVLFKFSTVFANMVNIPESSPAIKTLAPTVFIVSILAVFRGYFQGMKTTVPSGTSQMVEQVFNAIFSILVAFVLIPFGLPFVAAGGTSGTGIGAFCGMITILIFYSRQKNDIYQNFKYSKPSTASSKDLLKEILMTAFPIILGTAIFSITNLIDMSMSMDRLMASGAFTEMQSKALYGQLSGKYVVLTTLPVSISTAMATASIPTINSLITEGKTKLASYKINNVVKITMIICVPAAFGLGVLADPILALLFPTAPDGGNLLRFGTVSIILLALSQILTGVLQGSNKIYVPVFAALMGALIKIPISYVLIAIPKINIMGAIISTIACYFVASMINYHFVKNKLNIKLRFNSILLKPIIASTCMSIAVIFVYKIIFMVTSSNMIGVFLSIGLGAITYFFILYKIKGITPDDVSSLPLINKYFK